MSKINFRLYGDQIYGLSKTYLQEYISPEINKEEFLAAFKNGQININITGLKKEIILIPQLIIKDLKTEKLEINIPDEKSNMSINISKLKIMFIINELNEEQILSLLIQKRQKLIKDFIKFAIKSIEKKEKSTFLDGLLDSLLNNAINGLQIEFNDIEIYIKCNNFLFLLKFEKISYNENEGVQIKNINLIFNDSNNINNKCDIIKNFCVKINIKASKDINNETNQLDINLLNLNFDINSYAFKGIIHIIKLFKDINYKLVFIRYQKLIDLYKPKKDKINDKKEYYKSLWFWAVKNIIRLQKYKAYQKTYIFDLIKTTQNKYIKKYLSSLNNDFDTNENFKDFDSIILPEEINILKATKEKVENQVLENKKGNQLTNAFNFFFGGGGTENKNELSEEEKQRFNDIYSDEGLIKYLTKKIEIKQENSNEGKTLDKIKNYFNKISYNININKIEIVLNDLYSKHSLYINDINIIYDINRYTKTKNILFDLSDFGFEKNNSFIKDKLTEGNKVIKFIKKDDIYELNFGFKNLEINEKIVLFMINFYYSLYYIYGLNLNKNKFFTKSKYKINKKEKEKEKNIFDIIDKIKINNIPSINFINSNNSRSILLNIKNFCINKTSINFVIDLKDNNSNAIIDNYQIKIEKDENNFEFNLDLTNKLSIIFPSQITIFIFSFFYKIMKLKHYYQINELLKAKQKINKDKDKDILLYSSYYKIYKTLNIEKTFLEKIKLKLAIKNLIIIFQENNYKTNIFLANLTFTYSNKRNVVFKLGTLSFATYKLSTVFLAMINLKSPEFDKFEEYIYNKIGNEFNINMNKEELNQNAKALKDSNINEFNYFTHSGKIINQLINICKIYITEIKLNFKSEDNIFTIAFNRTFGEKQENYFIFNTENISLNYMNAKDAKNIINILDIKEKTNITYEFMKKNLSLRTKNPKINLNNDLLKIMKESFELKIDKRPLKGLLRRNEANLDISNITLLFNKFMFNIVNITVQNNAKFVTNSVKIIVNKFIMRRNDNKNGYALLKEKEFKLIYDHPNLDEKSLKIISNEISIMISQEDLYFFILYIANIYFDTKSNKKNSGNKNINPNNKKKNNKLNIQLELPKINLCLCKNNNFVKFGDLLLLNTKFCIKKYYKQINNNNTALIGYKKQTDFSILIQNILLKYTDMNNQEIILLKSSNDNNSNEQNLNHVKIEIKNKQAIFINIYKNLVTLTGDSIYFLYNYFQKAIPLQEIKEKAKQKYSENKLSKITLLSFNFDETQFVIPSSIDVKENLCLKIDKFFVLYNSINQSKFPLGSFQIKLSSMSCIISSNNIYRKLFYTKNEFLSVIVNYLGNSLNLKVNLDTFIMNLSYTDFATFLRVYYLNKILIANEQKLINQYQNPNEKMQVETSSYLYNNYNNYTNSNIIRNNSSYNFIPDIIEKSVLFSGMFIFENFNITFIDNSSGSYYPFAKLELTNINLDCKQDNTITSYFSILLSSYNYISCIWEPTIEKLFIQFLYEEKNEYRSKNFKIDLDRMNINISDMSISFTLSSLNNWIKKLIEEQKFFKNNEKDIANNNLNAIKRSITLSNDASKITNNKLINYTGVNIFIKYVNKAYTCEPYKQIELEYINEWDINKLGPKQISLALDKNNTYNIPIEKICTRLHKINNSVYIVSENVLSKEHYININIYSPIIFKNKSLYKLKVNIFNKNKGNSQYFLDENSVLGLPLFYYEPNTFFNFQLTTSNNMSINYSIDEIVNINNNNNNQIYKKNIIIDNTILLMNLSYKIPNVKTILIGCEYILINCLPCNIGLAAKNNNYIIEKCSQQYIDFYTGMDGDISIQINVNNNNFFSKPKKLFQKEPKVNGNFLKFRNSSNNETFKLNLLINKKENKKIIIIYAESILDNKSGIDFYINSKNICFALTNNLYLISSKLNMKESCFTINNDYYQYYSKNIYFKDIIHASPSYHLELKSGINSKKTINDYSQTQTQLIIDSTMSYITLKNTSISKYNIMTMIYRVHSLYRFTNLLSTKNFLIANQENPSENITIEPLSQLNFNFFHKGKNLPLLFSVYNGEFNYGKFSTAFRLLQIGTYTFKVGEYLFNLDIKVSSSKGIVDVFITETNFNNAKIIVDNLTNSEFNIYQKNYQALNQLISPNKKEILNIYDQNFMKFTIEYNNGLNSYDFEFVNSEIQEKQIELDNNIIMWIESNGIKMKISFFYKNILEENLNFSLNNNYNFAIKVNEVLISLIGDNEPKSKNLRNYQREEILLFCINELYLELRLDENQGLLKKDILKTYFMVNNLSLYNQSKNNIKFINALHNENIPSIGLRNEIYHFRKDNVWIIKGFALNLGNLKINIDPVFVEELMDFIKNIIYRMKIKNYNVDKLFLSNDDEFENNNQNLSLSKYKEKVKEYMKTYYERGVVFHGANFELPQLEIEFRISKIGLDNLLKDKFSFSSFFNWAAKGLTEGKHKINLEPYTIPLYIGDFKGIIKKIVQRYKKAVFSEFVTIGIKGVIGNISKALNKGLGKNVLKFINNALNKNDLSEVLKIEDINEEEDNKNENERLRIPRAFYGKFRYFKEFNQDHAYYFDLIPKKFQNNSMNFIFIDLIKTNNNNLYVFTNMSLILMTTYMEVNNIIYYFYIEEVKLDRNIIYIKYNQPIDGNLYFQLKEQNEVIAKKIAQKLYDISKNKDDFNDV